MLSNTTKLEPKSEEALKLSSLASRNTQGETFIPAFLTKGGVAVQGGAFAATLTNIEAYNKGERGLVEEDLRTVIPLLVKVGLFKLFPPEEWKSDSNEGRNFVGQLAKDYLENLEK